MLEVVDLACRRGDRRLFSNVGFSLEPGGLLSVLGKNGSGKTSLLRLVCGLLLPEDGAITWQGRNIAHLKEEYVAQLTYIGHLNGIKDDLTAMENLEIIASLAGERMSPGFARAALDAVGLNGYGDLPTRVLSQGQRRRVALARLWMSRCPLWVLDEPFTALDTSAGGRLTERLEAHLRTGGMVVLTTHHRVDITADSVSELSLEG